MYYNDPEPFGPSAKNSDLVFIRTGDRRYYYVIDKQRGICFFHARLYGRSHLEQMNCDDLPEYLSLHPKRMLKPPTTPSAEPKTQAPKAQAPQAPGPTPLTTDERESFRRAYVQHFCARKSKTPEELDVILSRHGIDPEIYTRGKAEFSADKDLWTALSHEAIETCP